MYLGFLISHSLCVMCFFSIFAGSDAHVDNLKSSSVLTSKVMMYNYATGNNVGTLHFLWKVPEDVSEEELSTGNRNALHMKVRRKSAIVTQ